MPYLASSQKGVHVAARILDGKTIAGEIQAELHEQVVAFVKKHETVPCLATILVGDDEASKVYVRNKHRACKKTEIESQMHGLPADASEEELIRLVQSLNAREEVHGILVQLPLPKHMPETLILDAIHPLKDVDAFHPENAGLVSQGRPRFLPCTPHGVQQILHRSDIQVAGKHAVVVGRSDIVGKPMATMLAARNSASGPSGANATVTICHSRTPDLASITKQADILIAAIGRPKFITADMVKPASVVVDVGINRTDDGLVGDVDTDAVAEVAAAITPVPGGVGPLTVMMLLHNTLKAAMLQTFRSPAPN